MFWIPTAKSWSVRFLSWSVRFLMQHACCRKLECPISDAAHVLQVKSETPTFTLDSTRAANLQHKVGVSDFDDAARELH